jgi:hypothetical protein
VVSHEERHFGLSWPNHKVATAPDDGASTGVLHCNEGQVSGEVDIQKVRELAEAFARRDVL